MYEKYLIIKNGEAVFIGSLGECEDWADEHDNGELDIYPADALIESIRKVCGL